MPSFLPACGPTEGQLGFTMPDRQARQLNGAVMPFSHRWYAAPARTQGKNTAGIRNWPAYATGRRRRPP